MARLSATIVKSVRAAHDQRAGERRASDHGDLQRGQQPEAEVWQEAREAGREPQRHAEGQSKAGRLVGIRALGGPTSRVGGDPAPVQEGAAAAGDHVQGLADALPLVVVHVARQVEEPVRLQGQVAGVEQLRARLVGFAIGEGRVGRDEQELARLGLGPALREEEALPEVGVAELAVDAPEVEPRRERERPVGGLLDRGVPRQRESVGPPDLGAEHQRGQRFEGLPGQPERLADFVEVEMALECPFDALPEGVLDGRGRVAPPVAGSARSCEGVPAEEATEPVEAVVPVVIAWNRQQHPAAVVLRRPAITRFHGWSRRRSSSWAVAAG